MTAGIPIAEILNAPLALADAVLTEQERRSGCVLVDIGADTTTVSVYTKNILRHLAVIPLGGANITKDITTLQMEEGDAEKMKLKYGSAYTDNNDIDNSLKYSIDSERQVESRKFIEIVEGRLEEIIENAWYQVPNEYYDKLLGGIIITGGTSNMPNIEKAFQNHTHIDKVRVAKSPIQTITGGNDDIKSKNAMMNTVIGLLLKGDMNCSGADIDPNGDLFSSTKPSVVTDGTDQRPARKASEVPTGVVRSEAEKQKAEEDARIKRDEEERKRQAEEAAAAAEAARIKRENSAWNKFKKGVLNFSKKMMEEEE
jgi:cell division protein FtsA